MLGAAAEKSAILTDVEYIMPETDRLTDSPYALSFFRHAYAASDLVSAGMSDKTIRTALSPGLPLAERWRICEPYFRWTRLTGYSTVHYRRVT